MTGALAGPRRRRRQGPGRSVEGPQRTQGFEGDRVTGGRLAVQGVAAVEGQGRVGVRPGGRGCRTSGDRGSPL